MAALSLSLSLLGALFLEQCASTASTTASLGGVVLWGLGDRRVMLDSRRACALPGDVDGRPGKVIV